MKVAWVLLLLVVSLLAYSLPVLADGPIITCPACGATNDNWRYDGYTDCRGMGPEYGLLPFWTHMDPGCGSTRCFGMLGGAPLGGGGAVSGGGYATLSFNQRVEQWER